MSEQGFDPFDDEHVPDIDIVAGDESLERLLSSEGDGWEPVEGDGWAPPAEVGDLESLLMEESAGQVPEILGSGTFESPVHHNPLPEEFGLPPQEDPSEANAQAAMDANKAILQSGISPALTDSPTLAVPTREALPSRSDAPAIPPPDDSRPIAVVVPGTVFLGGVGAGLYVLSESNPILGGIAIALSVVGSLFLRVLLKQ